jgi:hypothetical protein
MAGVLKEIENMLARGRLDLPVTLCFAVNKGDDFMLHQLLKRGLDPNESDNNGHTALVCTSMDSCVCVCVCVNIFLLNLTVFISLFSAYSCFQRRRTMRQASSRLRS